jgi:16S rRNA (cytidine1402-2'-O)-methyltransferase
VSATLWLVATPLGNLGDLSPRALALLSEADVVYCEDTRHTRTLYSVDGVSPRSSLRSLHEHNEASVIPDIIELLSEGRSVVVVSDAGTPLISDPGQRLVAAVADARYKVSTAPGTVGGHGALSVAGLSTDRFVMEGFVPRKAEERQSLFASFARQERTTVTSSHPSEWPRPWPSWPLCTPSVAVPSCAS